MKIEPCAYCGGKMFSVRTGACYCSSCLAIVENYDIAVHNRLSRIVRAAEEWARLLPHGPSGEYVKAVDALFEAVEGGQE